VDHQLEYVLLANHSFRADGQIGCCGDCTTGRLLALARRDGRFFAEEPITIRKLIPQALELAETTLTSIPSFSGTTTPKWFSRCATSHCPLRFARSLFHLRNQPLVTHRDELQPFLALIPGEEQIVEMILEQFIRTAVSAFCPALEALCIPMLDTDVAGVCAVFPHLRCR
jgi:hypothetical protein